MGTSLDKKKTGAKDSQRLYLAQQAMAPVPFAITLFNSRNRKLAMANERCSMSRRVLFYEIEFFPKTGGIAVIDGNRYPITAGSIRFHRPGQLVSSHLHYLAYALRMTLDGTDSANQKSQPSYRNDLLDAIPSFMSVNRPDQYAALYQEMLQISSRSQAASALLLKARALELLYLLYEDATWLSSQTVSRQATDAVSKAMQFMAENFTEQISLADIAAAANLSPYHFHRLFSRTASLTPQAHLTWLRIEKGRELLLTTENTISEIACACGFTQPAYFSRIFREHTGLTPSQFRLEHQVY